MSGAKLPDKISGFIVNEQKIQCEKVFILYKSWEVFQSRVELLFWKVFRVFWLIFLLLRHSSILESKLGLIQKVFQFVQEWVFEWWSIQKQKLNVNYLEWFLNCEPRFSPHHEVFMLQITIFFQVKNNRGQLKNLNIFGALYTLRIQY